MLQSVQEIRASITDLQAQGQAILAVAEQESRDVTADEQTSFDEILNSIESLEASEVTAQKREDFQAKTLQASKLQARADAGEMNSGNEDAPRTIVVPARAKAHGKLVAYDNERDAYVAGNVFLAGIFGNEKASQFCADQGLRVYNAQTEGVGTKGGFFVPEEMQSAMVRLREEYGVFSQYARSYPMASDSMFVPRDLDDVTAYWVGEAQEITESDKNIGGAELIAKKLACLTKVSSELDEDSVVSIGDMVTRSMAFSMAKKIDEAGWDGDGTSAYGGVTGLKNALHANAINDAASGSVAAASMVLGDFESTLGALPQYAESGARWFMHKTFYYGSIFRLQNVAGGTTGTEIGEGKAPQLGGVPITFVTTMPSAPGVSTICDYLGNLSLAATIGVRRGVQTQVSVDRYFENDLIGIRTTERVAINVHERGEGINERPILALKTAAS